MLTDFCCVPNPQAAYFRQELRAQGLVLGDEVSRAKQEQAAAHGAIERLGRAMAEGQAMNAMEARRQMDEQVGGGGRSKGKGVGALGVVGCVCVWEAWRRGRP